MEDTVDVSGGLEMQRKDQQTDLKCYCIAQDVVAYLRRISNKKKNEKFVGHSSKHGNETVQKREKKFRGVCVRFGEALDARHDWRKLPMAVVA